MFPEARVLDASDLHSGLSAEFERAITEQDILEFAQNSGDANPLHVDEDYARSSNYEARIVHGAFQIGLASAMIGMHLPGRNVLLGSVSARFPKPLYYPCRVRVTGQIVTWTPQTNTGTVKVTVIDVASHVATAEIHLGFGLHERRDRTATPNPLPSLKTQIPDGRRVVLVTGASGGLGSAIVDGLAAEYFVIAITRSRGLVSSNANVAQLNVDLTRDGWEDDVRACLGSSSLYGIVHAACPGQPLGSLIQTDDSIIEQQLSFGASRTVALARFLAAHSAGSGRIVALSSVVATHKPVLSLATYSLGKATLEHTVKLLAPELARKQITINAISPSFIATGMNKQSTDRQQLKEKALVPMGRLCEVGDVVEMVRYLLSPEASFVSGQVIGLAGAQL